jgi:hypothetical protein
MLGNSAFNVQYHAKLLLMKQQSTVGYSAVMKHFAANLAKLNMKNKLASFIGKYTGWDQNPASVFYLVIPLAVLGFGLMLAQAYLRYRFEHNPVFLYIWAGMVVLLVVALIPGFRILRITRKMQGK